jgi:hypothetical protein
MQSVPTSQVRVVWSLPAVDQVGRTDTNETGRESGFRGQASVNLPYHRDHGRYWGCNKWSPGYTLTMFCW